VQQSLYTWITEWIRTDLLHIEIQSIPLLSFIGLVTLILFLATGISVGLTYCSRKRNISRQNDTMQQLTMDDMSIEEFHYISNIRFLERKGSDNPWVITVMDCDNFREVNIRLGKCTGDQILKQIGDTFQKEFGNRCLITRSGASFIILSLSTDLEDIKRIYELIARICKETYDVDLLYATAEYAKDGYTSESLMQSAHFKLWELKREIWQMVEKEAYQSERLIAIGELAAGMAHEIRNPLTIIRGFIQMAEKRKTDLNMYYPIIIEEIDRMNSIIGEFLQYTKKVDHENMQQTSLNHCLMQSMMLVESLAIRNGHIIELQLCEEETPIIVDVSKIKQVIVNIVQNAFDAMEKNGRLIISTERMHSTVWLHIRDYGKGIPESDLADIFNPFFTTKSTGTGLGLAICKQIIEQHAGEIKVQSILNQGTTFSIGLPIQKTA
jgi:signal transduction histidine kinase